MKVTKRWVENGLPCEEGFPKPYAKRICTAPNGKTFGILAQIPDGLTEDSPLVQCALDDMQERFLKDNGF